MFVKLGRKNTGTRKMSAAVVKKVILVGRFSVFMCKVVGLFYSLFKVKK